MAGKSKGPKIGPGGAETRIVWHEPDGTPLSCHEKIKVMNENLEELREMAQDALEDAVLMGADEAQARAVLGDLIRELDEPFKKG